MIVVADTSPLNYLIQIGVDGVLPVLYQNVLVPTGVFEELSHPNAPAAVALWLRNLPDWLQVVPAGTAIPELEFLDLGERQAIELGEERHAHLLLIDERKGSRAARSRGFTSVGTLGILLAAKELGLLDPEQEYRLRTETSFRISSKVEAGFLRLTRL